MASGRLLAVVALAAGLGGAAWLIAHVGFKAIVGAALSVGWSGFALLLLYGVANFALLGAAWWLLTPPYGGRALPVLLWGRAVRDSAGEVLPFSALGGMAIAARAVTLFGVTPAAAVGSTVVDITLEMVAQILFVIFGLAILLIRLPASGLHAPLAEMAMAAVVLGSLAAGAFVLIQRNGLAALETITARFVPSALSHTNALRGAIADIHARPARLFANGLLHGAGWLSAAFGTWLTLRLLGAHIAYIDAVAIESLLCAARSAAVFVPSAIGIQEAGYAMMLPLFGLPADVALALALLKRAREFALAIPMLVSWQIAEGAFARRGEAVDETQVQPPPRKGEVGITARC